jgi:pyruvate/2-oxoglutarate dehydrogenase complex dihydrolipoamide acyltransferase (E2) component
MAHIMVLPQLGETIEEGEVEEWMIQLNDEVEDGEPILVVGTDKAALEINATASGRVTKSLRLGSRWQKLNRELNLK